jgi:hypothetical protein
VIRARTQRAPATGDRGQILVIMVGGFLAVIGMVALVVDGGNVWAQQRIVQNGADGSAQAGAIVLARRLAQASPPPGGWDAAVDARVDATATANGITVDAAYYTDICGIPLRADGTAALDPDGREDLASAVRVGGGSLPADVTTTPDCPTRSPGPPAGVLVLGTKDVPAYVAGAIGMRTFGVRQRATAVAGYLQGYCDATEDELCSLLPITIPVNAVTCDGQNNPVSTGDPWVRYQIYKIPLCGNGPGNVGWLDWTPPGGGANELVCAIVNPNNPQINLPSWQYVTQTGNPNGGGGPCSASIEEALRAYDGEVVLIPQFDITCSGDPNHSQVAVGPNYGCAASDVGGNGQNQWYRFPSFAFLELCHPSTPGCDGLHGAYIQGNNLAECDSGNGSTSCLIGRFVDALATGTVGAGVGGGSGSAKVIGIQLIR